MNKLVIGILAHVDAGKTTLSESLLYLSGKIRRQGRVDNGDAYLDTFELERARGITIFSKPAVFDIGDMQVTLLDTPGHVDFSAETERVLRALDYAVLVVSGADGIQSHTKTLWRLLAMYDIPTFIFVNKMDRSGADRGRLLSELRKQLSDSCIDFGEAKGEAWAEQLAMCDEELLEGFLKDGELSPARISEAIRGRRIFPCYFGSALRLDGVEELMAGIGRYAIPPVYPESFAARVYKISRDEQGNRLAYMKVTGGRLKVRDLVAGDKVNGIRIYSGSKYESVNEVEAGTVCAVTGLGSVKAGDGLGEAAASENPVLEPVLLYRIILPSDCDPKQLLPALRALEEEEPELHIVWGESSQEIHARLMGDVQMEVLRSLIRERFAVDADFGEGNIVYKETIANTVEGVGHFEPLRHYAEVHLILEPGERGSGLSFAADCSEDALDGNWQRLILKHLKEKKHRGVLTGAEITDMRITLAAGRAHNKHTEGGDFREATYRAVRQGLMQAESVLLEPYYSFRLELPEKSVGRAMTDIEKMNGSFEISHAEGEMTVLSGSAPVSAMRNYQREVVSYTKGEGRLFCTFKGYERCEEQEKAVRDSGYDPERDLENPSGSVFCLHGAGCTVSWDRVKEHMHVEARLKKKKDEAAERTGKSLSGSANMNISLEEIERIMTRTFFANRGEKSAWKRKIPPKELSYTTTGKAGGGSAVNAKPKEEWLLVDGYNIIHAWPELRELAQVGMDSARERLLDELCKFQYVKGCRILAVFDAYRVEGRRAETEAYNNIQTVYTGEAQTADSYIERYVHENGKRYDITVATSDAMEQLIIRGGGSRLLSARELIEEIEEANAFIMREYERHRAKEDRSIMTRLSEETRERLSDFENSGGGTDDE